MPFSQNSASENKKNVECVKRILDELFPNPTPPLTHTDPFTLLISVLLSAICSDERVNSVTPTLFALAPTPQAMAQLCVEQIQTIIQTLNAMLAPPKEPRRPIGFHLSE